MLRLAIAVSILGLVACGAQESTPTAATPAVGAGPEVEGAEEVMTDSAAEWVEGDEGARPAGGY